MKSTSLVSGIEDIRIPTMSTSLALMIGVIIPLYLIILLLRYVFRQMFSKRRNSLRRNVVSSMHIEKKHSIKTLNTFRSRILTCLAETGDFFSERTKNMHAQFVKVSVSFLRHPLLF